MIGAIEAANISKEALYNYLEKYLKPINDVIITNAKQGLFTSTYVLHIDVVRDISYYLKLHGYVVTKEYNIGDTVALKITW